MVESVRVGSACTLVALVVVGFTELVKPDPGFGGLLTAAASSAFVSATASWAFLVARHPNPSRRRVGLAMSGASVLGHFLTWAIYALAASPLEYLADPFELLKVPILALFFGLASLALFGWLTIPLEVGIGLFFLKRRGTHVSSR